MLIICFDPTIQYYGTLNINMYHLVSDYSIEENNRYNEICRNNNLGRCVRYCGYKFQNFYTNKCNIGKKSFERNIKLILLFRKIVYDLSHFFNFAEINKSSLYFSKIRTWMFKDPSISSIPSFIVGTTCDSKNNTYMKKDGIIRIARFTNSFTNVKNNYCYYGDIYFKQLIRTYRKKSRTKKSIMLILLLRNKLLIDTIRYICKFV